MSGKRTTRPLWMCVLVTLCALLGLATAPVGVPLVEAFSSKAAPDMSGLVGILTSGDPAAGWQAWIGGLLAAEGGAAALATWCLIAGGCVGVALLMQSLNKPQRSVDQGVLGDARLIDRPLELHRRNDFWDGEGTPAKAGLVVGSSRRGYLFDSSVPHWAVVGKTGSGKSFLMVLQTLHLCMARGWNLIVTGKDELLELTGDKAVELGYSRVVIDLGGYPQASRFNPVELISEFADAERIDLAQRTARQTAADLIPIGRESNTYFPKAARSLLTACLLIVATANIPREQRNMSSVCSLVSLGTTGEGDDPSAPLKDYIRSEAVGPEHPAYSAAADFLSDGGTTTAGKNVLSTLKEALTIFGDEGIRRATCRNDVSIRDIVREKTVVYMHLLAEGDPYQAVMTAFINQYWRVAQEEAAKNGGRLPRETAIVGDEWGNLPTVSALPEIVTLGRSFHLHAYCFTQDLKQWNKYNRPEDQNAGRDKILGSMGGKVALSLANPEDFEYFTKLAGKRTVRSQSVGASRHGMGLGATPGSSESYTERADDLIHPWEWKDRIPARDGIVVVKGGENSAPGREGVFQMPAGYAPATPAGRFFGLGDETACDEKRRRFRATMEEGAESMGEPPDPWTPDFEAFKSKPNAQKRVVADEWSAWDGM